MNIINAPKQQYWIQEYNAPGNNWVDYCGFDPSKTLDEAVEDRKRTSKAFPKRVFRLIVRTDAVLD